MDVYCECTGRLKSRLYARLQAAAPYSGCDAPKNSEARRSGCRIGPSQAASEIANSRCSACVLMLKADFDGFQLRRVWMRGRSDLYAMQGFGGPFHKTHFGAGSEFEIRPELT